MDAQQTSIIAPIICLVIAAMFFGVCIWVVYNLPSILERFEDAINEDRRVK